MNPTHLLRVKDLSLSIHGQSILSDINFSVRAGHVLGIIGESGSGKSMTAYAIMQLLPQGSQAQGEIVLDGHSLLDISEPQMCDVRGNDIGFIFQEPMTALNPLQTIGHQVAETVIVHGGATRREAMIVARQTLDRVGLPEAQFPLFRYPHELSGGQRQRVMIAMSIALKPRLLIADEPTTALDVTTQDQILQVLKRLVIEDQMALIFITHDLAVVSNIAHDLVILRDGKVVESGNTVAVFRHAQHPYTQQLLAASCHVPERVDSTAQKLAPLLSVGELVREYRTPPTHLFGKPGVFRALDKVTFELERGESVGLVGESGCGKSTLTRAILGLDRVQGGHITLDGEPILAGDFLSHKVRRKMQVVFQDPFGSFNPRHQVHKLISEPFHCLEDAPQRQDRNQAVIAALESVGMRASDAKKYIHEFSGGQRQRIAIARALIIKPALIILDEAVSALDVSIRAQILDLLAALARQYHLTYLFISHDLSVVRNITDRVLVMQQGTIVERGATDKVFNHPQHDYTRALIDAIPMLNNSQTKFE